MTDSDPSTGETPPPERTPRALILGTSNSILREGWLDGFRSTFQGEVINRSVGASTCTYALFELVALGQALLENVDYVFVDSIVNDEHFVAKETFDPDWCDVYTQDIYRTTSHINPIGLGFSSEHCFQHTSDVALRHETIARTVGTTFISFRRILKWASQTASRKHDKKDVSIYEDPGHFHRHLAKQLGAALGERISELAPATPRERQMPLVAYRVETFAEHASAQIERTTTLRTQKLSVFDGSGKFALEGAQLVHGICVNANNCDCYLNIETQDRRISKRLLFGRDGSKMQLKMVNFRHPIEVPTSGCRFSVTAEPLFLPEHSMHSKNEPQGPAVLELAGILVSPVVAVASPPATPVMPQPDKLTEFEQQLVRAARLVNLLVNPPEIPQYPRSWIEL